MNIGNTNISYHYHYYIFKIQALRSQLVLIEKHNIEHLLRPTQRMLRSLKDEHDVGSDDDLEVSDDDDSQAMTDSEPLGDSIDVQLDELSDSGLCKTFQ